MRRSRSRCTHATPRAPAPATRHAAAAHPHCLHLQELQGAQSRIAALQQEREAHLAQAQERCRELSAEASHRKGCQEALAKRLAARDQELTAMRVQVNNQRLGTVVQKFSGPGIDAPHESLEPAFAYHQLQAVRCLLWWRTYDVRVAGIAGDIYVAAQGHEGDSRSCTKSSLCSTSALAHILVPCVLC